MRKILSILLSVVLVLSVMPITVFSAETDSGSVGESYNLWLGSTQVTDENKGDIFGNGKASFDSSTNTLTLNAPTINGVYNQAKIFSGIQLTVKGSYSTPSGGDELDLRSGEESNYGLRCNNQLRLDGNFTFRGNDAGIYCSGDIFVDGGYVYAYGGDTAMECNKLTIGDAVTRVVLSGFNRALYASYLVNAYIVTPENGHFEEGTIFKEGSYDASYVVLEPKAPDYEEYDIWLGIKQITSKNKNDILGDGKATYDPQTYTLTLNEPTISGLKDGAKIFAGSEVNDLKIKGSYHMTGAEGKYGVKSACFDYFDGDFAFYGTDCGITYTTQLHIDGGSLYAEGGECGIEGPTSFLIKDNVSRVELKGNIAAMKSIDNYLNMNLEAFVITTPEGGSFKRDEYSTFYEADGTTIAKHVVIEADPDFKRYDLWLGWKQITSKKKNDILGAGKATYDPRTNTLTLNEPVISGGNNNSKIYAGNDADDLIIKGSYHMIKAEYWYGLKTDVSVHLDGDFAFMGIKAGLTSVGDVCVEGGSLYAEGSSPYTESGNGVNALNFRVKNAGDVTRVELKGKTEALSCTNDLYMKGFVITAPEGGLSENGTIYEADGVTKAAYVVIEPDQIVCGDIFVDGNINISDVTAIQRHVAEMQLLTGNSLRAADTNGDGEVTIEDATHLQMYLAEYDVALG